MGKKKPLPEDYEHVHFRVPSELRKKLEALKEMADCTTDSEYFRFLIRQELKSSRISVFPQK